MIQTEIKFVLNQDEGSYGASFFGLKWYTIAPPHRYNFSPALTGNSYLDAYAGSKVGCSQPAIVLEFER